MTVTQMADILNTVTSAMLGEQAVPTVDLTNVVDVGKAIQNLDSWQNKIINGLVNQIGKVHFVDRVYEGDVPSLFMDSWQYGSIMAKYQTELPETTKNPAWELKDGTIYSEDMYLNPPARAKFWNKMDTAMVQNSIPDYQLMDSFKDQYEMASFISMLQNAVYNKLALDNQAMVYSCLSHLIGETIASGQATQKYNLLSMYNNQFGTSITAADALYNKAFLRYCVIVMQRVASRMGNYSMLFNTGEKKRFTPASRLKTVMHTDFKSSFGVYLYNAENQYSTDYLSLVKADTVPYWIASGTDYSFAETSKVAGTSDAGHSYSQTGVVAIMFDEWAAGVANIRARTDTKYNVAANFTNYWHKRDGRYFNDLDENAVVFYIA